MEEFTCASCGRLVHRVNNCIPSDICFECFHVPNWHDDSDAAKALETQYIDRRDASYRSEWPTEEEQEEKAAEPAKTAAPSPSKPTATTAATAPKPAAQPVQR